MKKFEGTSEFEGTGWAQIVLNLRTGEFFPAEPVGFWTSGFRYAVRIGLNFPLWVFAVGTAAASTRKKFPRLEPVHAHPGVYSWSVVQLRTFNRDFSYIMILGLSVRSRLVHSSPNFESKIRVLYMV